MAPSGDAEGCHPIWSNTRPGSVFLNDHTLLVYFRGGQAEGGRATPGSAEGLAAQCVVGLGSSSVHDGHAFQTSRRQRRCPGTSDQ